MSEASRRLTLRAFDPPDGEMEVFVSHQRLMAIARRGSLGQIREAQHLLAEILQSSDGSTVVFEGLCTDADEDERGVGWRCYAGRPSMSYTADGVRRAARFGQVFLVFVNDERVAYNWRWEPEDPDSEGHPVSHATRFKRRIFPCQP